MEAGELAVHNRKVAGKLVATQPIYVSSLHLQLRAGSARRCGTYCFDEVCLYALGFLRLQPVGTTAKRANTSPRLEFRASGTPHVRICILSNTIHQGPL